MAAVFKPEFEVVDRSVGTVNFLEHGWPSPLCRWHSHDAYELHLTIATSGRAFVGDYIGEFEPGSLYLVGSRLPHNWVTQSGSHPPVGLRDMLIQFHPDSIEEATSSFPELREVETLLEESALGVEFIGFELGRSRSLFDALRESSGMQRLLLSLEFLLELSAWTERRQLSVLQMDDAGPQRQARFSTAVEYIMHNYTSPLSLESAAAVMNMTPSAFSRSFRKATGNRFSDFIARVRIGHACSLLMNSDDLVAEISAAVGFNNLANFNRQFLRYRGMSPSEYRQITRERLAARQLSALPQPEEAA